MRPTVTCPQCGFAFALGVSVSGNATAYLDIGYTNCPKCGGDVPVGKMVVTDGKVFKVAQEVVGRLSFADSPIEFAKMALAELQEIRNGKDLSDARSQGKLKTMKRLKLMPRNAKEVAIYAGILMAFIKLVSSLAKNEKPTVQNIVNIYQQQGTAQVDQGATSKDRGQ